MHKANKCIKNIVKNAQIRLNSPKNVQKNTPRINQNLYKSSKKVPMAQLIKLFSLSLCWCFNVNLVRRVKGEDYTEWSDTSLVYCHHIDGYSGTWLAFTTQ